VTNERAQEPRIGENFLVNDERRPRGTGAAASGIVQGSQETGKDVTVVGFDSGKTQIDAIKAGTEAGAVTQSPVKIGYYTVKAAVVAINKGELPKVIDSGFAWYDKTNIDNAEIKANLYE